MNTSEIDTKHFEIEIGLVFRTVNIVKWDNNNKAT